MRTETTLTDNEAAETARLQYAKICNRLPVCWDIITEPDTDTWYDFYDLATGKYGQCLLLQTGTWHQAPCGENPTILAYKGTNGKQFWKEARNDN